MEQEEDVGDLLGFARQGDEEARGRLYRLVYDELRAIARAQMSNQRPDHTLQATALVNEVYIRLSRDDGAAVNSREHFFRLASRVMRQILVDHARARASQKRQADGQRVELDALIEEYDTRSGGLVELDEALSSLEARSPELVRLVELRFFGGRSMEEIARTLGVSERQAARLWSAARLFLKDRLQQMPK